MVLRCFKVPDAGAAGGWHALSPFLPPLPWSSARHFCKVMSSADNGFSIPGEAGVPDIVPWRRDSGKQIVHPLGMGMLSRPPPPPTSHSDVCVAEGRPMVSGLLVSQPLNDQNCKSPREELLIFFLVQMGI